MAYLTHFFIKTLQMPAAFDAGFRCSGINKVAKVKQHRAEAVFTSGGSQKARNDTAEVQDPHFKPMCLRNL